MGNRKGVKRFLIQPQNTDFQGRITTASMGHMILDTSDQDADDNGFGMRILNQMNASWVLSRLAIEFNSTPLQYEEVDVQTWISSISRMVSTRNFCIRDITGRVRGNAVTLWAMIDLETRRPINLHQIESIHSKICDEPCLMSDPVKLNAIEGEEVDSFRVKYSDVDINGHANSISYISKICDCFTLDEYRNFDIQRFEINYLSEIKYGEEAQIHKMMVSEHDYRFEIRKAGKVCSRARVVLTHK